MVTFPSTTCYCVAPDGVEIGFTCDATLCTNTCTNRDLVKDACAGLGTCARAGGLSAIALLESQFGCSCCASQICRCPANPQTNTAIATLDQEQRDRGLVPQCDLNGTLCGTEP